ncbi:MAG TPA: YraN family protein [Candidatus Dojkabacteria bacterium]|nr:YraN family protein [Candidatus Dojkabacteria bacterium]
MDTRTKGRRSENIAAYYLVRRGFNIIAKNKYFNHREIDLFVKYRSKYYIVEVKSSHLFSEEYSEMLTASKIKNLQSCVGPLLSLYGIDNEDYGGIIYAYIYNNHLVKLHLFDV